MKITEIVCQIIRIPQVMAKTASSQDSVIVRVRADNGLEGVGEADSSDRKSTRLNSSHVSESRMPSSA